MLLVLFSLRQLGVVFVVQLQYTVQENHHCWTAKESSFSFLINLIVENFNCKSSYLHNKIHQNLIYTWPLISDKRPSPSRTSYRPSTLAVSHERFALFTMTPTAWSGDQMTLYSLIMWHEIEFILYLLLPREGIEDKSESKNIWLFLPEICKIQHIIVWCNT